MNRLAGDYKDVAVKRLKKPPLMFTKQKYGTGAGKKGTPLDKICRKLKAHKSRTGGYARVVA